MRTLLKSELDRVCGGMQPVARGSMLSPDDSPYLPINPDPINWSNVSSDVSSWFGDASGSSATDAFSLAVASTDNGNISFTVDVGQGMGTVFAQSPGVNGGIPVPLGEAPLTPSGNSLRAGIQITNFSFGDMTVNGFFGVSTKGHGGTLGANVSLKFP